MGEIFTSVRAGIRFIRYSMACQFRTRESCFPCFKCLNLVGARGNCSACNHNENGSTVITMHIHQLNLLERWIAVKELVVIAKNNSAFCSRFHVGLLQSWLHSGSQGGVSSPWAVGFSMSSRHARHLLHAATSSHLSSCYCAAAVLFSSKAAANACSSIHSLFLYT